MPAFEIFIVASLTASHSSGEEPGTLASQLVYLRSLQGEENLSQQETANIAQQLLADMGSGAEPEDISTLFSTDVQFEIPGDIGALPRSGRGIGRVAVSDFIRGTRQLLERVASTFRELWRTETGPSSSVISLPGSFQAERQSNHRLL
jgi:hypothetical protein